MYRGLAVYLHLHIPLLLARCGLLLQMYRGLAVCLHLHIPLLLARCGLLLQMYRDVAVSQRLHIALVLDAAYCYRCERGLAVCASPHSTSARCDLNATDVAWSGCMSASPRSTSAS